MRPQKKASSLSLPGQDASLPARKTVFVRARPLPRMETTEAHGPDAKDIIQQMTKKRKGEFVEIQGHRLRNKRAANPWKHGGAADSPLHNAALHLVFVIFSSKKARNDRSAWKCAATAESAPDRRIGEGARDGLEGRIPSSRRQSPAFSRNILPVWAIRRRAAGARAGSKRSMPPWVSKFRGLE